jgi:hypothetical protein
MLEVGQARLRVAEWIFDPFAHATSRMQNPGSNAGVFVWLSRFPKPLLKALPHAEILRTFEDGMHCGREPAVA